MKEEKVLFRCGDISLEGVFMYPESGEAPVVVVCHPHPQYGGNMDNNVVHAVCQALRKKSIASLRFNFRGVGRSEGRYADGIGEQDDIVAALSFMEERAEIDSQRLGLCGYSFGTMVAIPVADRDARVQAVAGISPFFVSPGLLQDFQKPKYFICGSRDAFADPRQLDGIINALPDPKMYDIIEGADHFWWGYDDEVGTKVADFFSSSLS